MASTQANARGLSTSGKSKSLRRAPAGPFSPRLELAREQAAGQGRPRQDAHAFLFAQRHDLALDVAAGDRVVHLGRDEARAAGLVAERQRLHGLPRGEVAEAHVAGLAGAHHVVEGAQRLLQRRDGIHAVDLVQVDVIGAQAAQAPVDAVHDVLARQAHVVGAGAGAAAHLGGEHELAAVEAHRRDGLAYQALALALVVDVGRIQEVHAAPPARG
jgi:hypothetical protein